MVGSGCKQQAAAAAALAPQEQQQQQQQQERPAWAVKHAATLSVVATTFGRRGLPLPVLTRICFLAHGDELEPIGGWDEEWRAFTGRSAERAVLAELAELSAIAPQAEPAVGQRRSAIAVVIAVVVAIVVSKT